MALDPDHIRALVGTAVVDFNIGANFSTDDRAARLAAAEATLIKVLSQVPQHALAHEFLGIVYMLTNRAARGIAECERAIALDRNLADAHAIIGWAKSLLDRSEETEAHILEALRLSPRDVFAYRWMMWAGNASNANADAVAWLRRSIEANRNFPLAHFHLAAALALLGSPDEARAAAQAGLALNSGFTIRRFRRQTPSNNPTYLAKRERVYQGMRLAGVPEG